MKSFYFDNQSFNGIWEYGVKNIKEVVTRWMAFVTVVGEVSSYYWFMSKLIPEHLHIQFPVLWYMENSFQIFQFKETFSFCHNVLAKFLRNNELRNKIELTIVNSLGCGVYSSILSL